jgi:proteasome lid subunit RPN8/RPN11
MKYCRVSIDHTTRGGVYKKDFDPQHVFGPLVRAFAAEMIRQKMIREGEHYTAIIIPRYEDTLVSNPIMTIDSARAQEARATWIDVEFQDGQNAISQPITFFTMELRFRESGVIYRQDLQISTLDYFWQNIQTALLKMHVLEDGDLYIPRIAVHDDDDADFSQEEIHVRQGEVPLIELVETDSAAPAMPLKSPTDFDVIEIQEVELVSPAELTELDTERQDDVQVFIAQHTFETLQAVARQDVQVEQGGVLVGRVYRSASAQYLIEITGHIVAEGASANAAELHYNYDSWLHQNEYLKEHFPGQRIVGWYHTHLVTIAIQPDENTPELQTTELFFSDHDRFMHRRFFSEPWYVAMVLGPQGNTAFFRWFGDKISSNRRFYVFKPEPPASETA